MADEAARKKQTRQEEAKAKEAEKARDSQERNGKGPVIGITDSLTGR